jgi:hypothetical protein
MVGSYDQAISDLCGNSSLYDGQDQDRLPTHCIERHPLRRTLNFIKGRMKSMEHAAGIWAKRKNECKMYLQRNIFVLALRIKSTSGQRYSHHWFSTNHIYRGKHADFVSTARNSIL